MVYIDNARIPYRRYRMCHMLADSRAELLAMAEQLGLAAQWLQHEGEPAEHYDVCLSKRAKAIRLGALPVRSRYLVALIRLRRHAQAA